MAIYVHVPFCRSKCAYCDFYSMPRKDLADRYVGSVAREMQLRAVENGSIPDTIYIGGGTPSQLTDKQFVRLMSALPAPLAGAEVTVEVNPDDVTDGLVAVWRACGVNRVSMGVQSMVDAELSLIGRRHTAADVEKAYLKIRDGGISNISLDLIYGLPRQTVSTWQYSLDRLLALNPEHISAYMLSYEPGTRLWAMRASGKITETDEDTELEMYRRLCRTTDRAGYEHYEISNFALPGRRAVHNSSYWQGKPYLGLGPGAHSWDGTMRRYNPTSLKKYIDTLESGRCFCETEAESAADRTNNLIMVSLRRREGLDTSLIPECYRDEFAHNLSHISPHLIQINHNGVIIPEEHWPVSDAIIRELFVE